MPMTRWSALSSIRLLKDGDIEKTNAQFNRIMDKEPIRIACFYEEENLQRFNYKVGNVNTLVELKLIFGPIKACITTGR